MLVSRNGMSLRHMGGTLHIRRKLKKYLTFQAPLDASHGLMAFGRGSVTPTFTRATVATYIDPVTGFITTAPSGVPRYEANGYLAEGARTNLFLQSSVFDSVSWVQAGTVGATADNVGPDGIANSAYTLTDNSASICERINQVFTLTAANYTQSIYVKKTSGAQASYPLIQASAAVGLTAALVTIDTSNGIATVWTAYTGLTIVTTTATITSFNANYWRVTMTFLATAQNWTCEYVVAGTTNATQSTGIPDVAAQGTAVFFGAQLELGAFASSYIPTTSAAVTRNQDVLDYPLASNWNDSVGSIIASVNHYYVSSVNGYYVTCSGANRVALYQNGNPALQAYDGTNNPTFSDLALVANSRVTVGATFSGSTENVFKGGVKSSTTGAFAGTWGYTGNLRIGIGSAGTTPIKGNESNVLIFGVRLPNSDMALLTSRP